MLSDTTYPQALGLNDTIVHNAENPTHTKVRKLVVKPYHRLGLISRVGTAKMGVNYNITDHMNVFFNGGVCFRPPTIRDAFTREIRSRIVDGVGTEIAWGLELGYSVKYPRWGRQSLIFTDQRGNSTSVPTMQLQSVARQLESIFRTSDLHIKE